MRSSEARDLAAGIREEERRKRVKFYQRNLFKFCVEILGYDKLSESFHGPLLARWDAIDKRRWAGEMVDTLDLWPRDHIKTWCERARVLRYFLVDPTWTHTWWHAVEEMAQESAQAIGKQILLNKELRAIWPKEALPAINAKKFVQAGGFALRTNRIGDAPSMRAWGAGSEATGGHSKGGTLDDVNAFNDVVDNQFPAKWRWYQGTVCNVIRVSEGFKNGLGTRWAPDDTYSEWLKSDYWDCIVRACLETDGKPDYDGTPVYLTKEQIAKKRAELGPVMFALQMMNDAATQEDRPWKPEYERYCTLKEAAEYQGAIVTLSDPAPEAIGGSKDLAFKARGDGTKNEWATVTLKVAKNGERFDVVLLDGEASKGWDTAAGFDAMCNQGRKWKAQAYLFEASGSAEKVYADEFRKACRRTGTSHRRTKFEGSNNAEAKQTYFGLLCASARIGEFSICESCPDAFVDGLLNQVRNWRNLGGAKNGLKLDDRANVVSMVFDSAIRRLAPMIAEYAEWSPFSQPEPERVESGSRHVRW